MLSRIIIENYRSIQNLDLPVQQVNAFIGANSCGKSNILRALNLVLGPIYATIKSFEDVDFYQKSRANQIVIEVHFQNHLTCNHDVYGFRLHNTGTEVTYYALGYNHHPLTYQNGREVRVSSEMKEEVNLIYLTLDRLSYQQVKPTQWAIYGKLLKYIASTITDPHKAAFLNDLNLTYQTNVNPHVTGAEQLLQNYVQEQTGKQLNLRLSIIDPTMVLRELRPRIIDNGFEVDVEEEGAGIQSSVSIAIARTYAQITQMPLILAIEEPELYLHPHACRHFYNLLKGLATNNIQVFYSTHERSFVNVSDYEYIKRVVKDAGITEVRHYSGNIPNFDRIKLAAKFDEELNEIFFAEKVILVEGPADKIALKYALEIQGVDLDAHNISIVDCGSITAIKPLVEILSHFRITPYVLVDQDPGNQNTANTVTDILGVLPPQNLYRQNPNLEGLFNVQNKFTKESALRQIPNYYQNNAMQQFYSDIKTALNI